MAAHRFWRLTATCRQLSGGFVFGVAEFVGAAAPGGPTLFTGGAPLAPQAADPGFPASAAFDGEAATFYRRNGNTRIDLGYEAPAPIDVAEVRLRFGATGSACPGSAYSPAAAVIQYSDDGQAWRSLAPALDLTEIGDGGEAVFLLAEPSARLGAAPIRFAGPAVPAQIGVRPAPSAWRYDAADGGPYRVAGTVAIDGTPATPVRRRVRLFHRLSGRLVREVWSAADGTFAFERIAAGEYVVMSDDYTRAYNAVVADAVLAVP